jgi:serine/threonine protein kinase
MNNQMNRSHALIGQVIGGYRLDRIIGHGSTGVVFQGRQPSILGRSDWTTGEVAVKVLMPPSHLSTAELNDFRARFRREAEIMRQLHHPHILPVNDSGEDIAIGLPFIILPYLSNGTLANRQLMGPLALTEIIHYAEQIASALDYAHQQGVVHRDVKPANVLLDSSGKAYLADFGIVKLFDTGHTSLTTMGQVIGTPEYMAPEQARGDQVGPAADIYGLGVLLYHLVTGRVPFKASNLVDLALQLATVTPESPCQLRPDLPGPAEEAIMCALRKDPAARFASAGELAQAFAMGVQGQWSTLPDDSHSKEEQVVPIYSAMPTMSDLPTKDGSSHVKRNIIRGIIASLLIVGLVLSFLVLRTSAFFSPKATHQPIGKTTTSTAVPNTTASSTVVSSTTTRVATRPTTPIANLADTVDITTASVSILPYSDQSVSATCQDNEQMVGGGWNSDSGPAFIRQSYPSSKNTWKAAAYNETSSKITLTAYAICLKVNFDAGMQIVSSSVSTISGVLNTVNTSLSATCPTGTIVTSGGFLSSPGLTSTTTPALSSSFPTSTGWTITGWSSGLNETFQAYAMCSTSHLQFVTYSKSNLTIVPKNSSSTALTCHTGLMTGAGFANSPDTLNINALTLQPSAVSPSSGFGYAGFSMNGDNTNSVSVIGICVSY